MFDPERDKVVKKTSVSTPLALLIVTRVQTDQHWGFLLKLTRQERRRDEFEDFFQISSRRFASRRVKTEEGTDVQRLG